MVFNSILLRKQGTKGAGARGPLAPRRQHISGLAGAFGSLLALVLALGLLMVNPAWAQGPPALPFFISGSATVNAKAAAGVAVTASDKGAQVAGTTTDISGGYSLTIAGGVNGDTLQLFVSGMAAGTATFSSGGVVSQNLAVTSPGRTDSSGLQAQSSGSSRNSVAGLAPESTPSLTAPPAQPKAGAADSSRPAIYFILFGGIAGLVLVLVLVFRLGSRGKR